MDIYTELGVTRIINASGSMTVLGGSLMAPEVVEAMDRAARAYVDMHELMAWAGDEIARLTGAEAGLVTTGTAGGMLLSAAACLTGTDRKRMAQLPDTSGMPREIVVQQGHRISFDDALRTPGGVLVEVGGEDGATAEQVNAAISDATAAAFYVVLDPLPALPLTQFAAVAHARDVPVIVDAAAEVPPLENLHRFLDEGGDLVLFSGGKHIGGPNDSGILCGRRNLVEAAAAQAFPNYGIGRPLKVSKEQIVGLVFALRRFVNLDHAAEMQRYDSMAQTMCGLLQGLNGVTADVAYPTHGARPLCIPRARVVLEPGRARHDARGILTAMRTGKPAVAIGADQRHNTLWLNPQHLLDGEETTVAERLRVLLDQD